MFYSADCGPAISQLRPKAQRLPGPGSGGPRDGGRGQAAQVRGHTSRLCGARLRGCHGACQREAPCTLTSGILGPVMQVRMLVTEPRAIRVQGHMLPHSMPVPVRLAWPHMAYGPGLSMPVPLHMLAAQFPQAYSAAAGERAHTSGLPAGEIHLQPYCIVSTQYRCMCLHAIIQVACAVGAPL